MQKQKFILPIIATIFLFSICPFVLAVWNTDLNNNLISVWQFSESSGITTENAVNTNYNGDLVNDVFFVSGVNGNAVSISGGNNYVDIANSISEITDLNDFTINFWSWYDVVGGTWVPWNSKIQVTSAGSIGTDAYSAGGYPFWLYTGDISHDFSPFPVNLYGGTWQMITFVRNSTNDCVYINSVLKACDIASGSITPSGWYFGREAGYADASRMLLDEFYVWDRYLNETEIQSLTIDFYPTPVENDTTPPVININYPANISYVSVNKMLFSATDNNLDACWYSLDNGATNITTPCNSPITSLTTLPNNSYSWRVYANDTFGNENFSSVSFSIYPAGYVSWTSNYNSGLVSVWQFSESSGITTENAVNTNYNGDLINDVNFVEGINGNAINISGGNNYVDIANSISEITDLNDFTINFWSWYDVVGGTWVPWNSKIQVTSAGSIGTDAYSAGGYPFWLYTGDISHDFSLFPANLYSESWQMVTFLRNSTNDCVFVNGTLYKCDAVAGSITPSGWYFGREAGYSGASRMLLDEFYVWNRSLTEDEVRLLHTIFYSAPSSITCSANADCGTDIPMKYCSSTGEKAITFTCNSAGTPSSYCSNSTASMPVCVYNRNINNCSDLQNIQANLSGSYILKKDIDCSATSSWNSGKGFIPITEFAGSFDGNGKTISNLFINRPSEDYVGLFSKISASASINKIKMKDFTITGNDYVGGMFGSNEGTITEASIKANILGNDYVGGLGGYNNGELDKTNSKDKVNGSSYVGGLIGLNDLNGEISNSYSHSDVWGDNYIGGLIGYNHGVISKCYAIGKINGVKTKTTQFDLKYKGHLYYNTTLAEGIAIKPVTSMTLTEIGIDNVLATKCYVQRADTLAILANASVSGKKCSVSVALTENKTYNILVDKAGASYNTRRTKVYEVKTKYLNVTSGVIGFAGTTNSSYFYNIERLKFTYQKKGGLNGEQHSETYASFFDIDTTGLNESDGGTGKTDAEMQDPATYLEWDLNNTWAVHSYPSLIWETEEELSPAVQNSAIYQTMKGTGAGLGLFISYISVPVAVLLIVVMMVAVIALIGYSLVNTIKSSLSVAVKGIK